MRFLIALWMAKLINALIGVIDASRGTNLAGEKAMMLDPKLLAHFRGIDPEKTLFITGTNGKSTTNNLIYHVFTQHGYRVCSNLAGANLITGVATSLIRASSLFGKVSADYFIFETDERYLPLIREQLPAANILVTNLQKDQVQRNGDPDYIYRKLQKAMEKGGMRLFLNNEEPRTKSFERYTDRIVT